MKAEVVWKRLLLEGGRVVSAEHVARLSESAGRGGRETIAYLLRMGRLERILRGVFYVRSPNEIEGLTTDMNIYEKIALALECKGVRRWYFAMETALKLNSMTHEHFTVGHVITDSYRTAGSVTVLGMRFKFTRRPASHFDGGIIIDEAIRYSNPTRTVLDLEYRDFLSREGVSATMRHARTYGLDTDEDVLGCYRPGFTSALERAL